METGNLKSEEFAYPADEAIFNYQRIKLDVDTQNQSVI